MHLIKIGHRYFNMDNVNQIIEEQDPDQSDVILVSFAGENIATRLTGKEAQRFLEWLHANLPIEDLL